MNYEANGWVAHQVSDLWAKTSPDRGEAVWALWPMGGAWLCTHLWEHYTYTTDKVSSDFLINSPGFYDLKSLTQNKSGTELVNLGRSGTVKHCRAEDSFHVKLLLKIHGTIIVKVKVLKYLILFKL